MFAPSAPHIAVSLRLTGEIILIIMKLRFIAVAEPHFLFSAAPGKPKAYRYVLRQRRKSVALCSLPFAPCPLLLALCPLPFAPCPFAGCALSLSAFASTFFHGLVIFGLAIAATAGLLPAMMHGVDCGPRAAFGFIFRNALLSVALFD